MKSHLLALALIIISSQSICQTSFLAGNKRVKTGKIEIRYTFYYLPNDSLNVYFSDSSIIYTSSDSTIIKDIYLKNNYKEPTFTIKYLTTKKKDSIYRNYWRNRLYVEEETRYDSLDREIYRGEKDFTSNSEFYQTVYEYRDSLTASQKFVIKSSFSMDSNGKKEYFHSIISEYDKNNNLVRELTGGKSWDDPEAHIFTHIYDDNNKEIEIRHRFMGNESVIPLIANPDEPCNPNIQRSIKVTTFKDFKPIIKKLLAENYEMINSDKCKSFIATYFSPDRSLKIIIRKVGRNSDGGNQVLIYTTKKF